MAPPPSLDDVRRRIIPTTLKRGAAKPQQQQLPPQSDWREFKRSRQQQGRTDSTPPPRMAMSTPHYTRNAADVNAFIDGELEEKEDNDDDFNVHNSSLRHEVSSEEVSSYSGVRETEAQIIDDDWEETCLDVAVREVGILGDRIDKGHSHTADSMQQEDGLDEETCLETSHLQESRIRRTADSMQDDGIDEETCLETSHVQESRVRVDRVEENHDDTGVSREVETTEAQMPQESEIARESIRTQSSGARRGAASSRKPTSQQKRQAQATAGWKIIKVPEWELVDESDFMDDILGEKYRRFYKGFVKRVNEALEIRRVEGTRADFVRILFGQAFHELAALCNSALSKVKEAELTNADEMIRFSAQVIGMGGQSYSAEKAYNNLQNLGWDLLPLERHKMILSCLRAYSDDSTRQGSEDSWICQDDITPKYAQLEDLLLKESRRLLFDLSNTCLVIDDELIGSRAKDVQVTTLSQRKAGKEGPVADVIAETLTRFVGASKLRPRKGKQDDAIRYLLIKLKLEQPGPWAGAMVTMDRGYCNPSILIAVVEMGLGCAFIMPDHLMFYHPYVSSTHVETAKQRSNARKASKRPVTDSEGLDPYENPEDELRTMCKEWTIPDGPMLGRHVAVASKDVKVLVDGVARNNQQKVFAIAIREPDTEKSCGVLRFYISNADNDRSFLHKWVAVYNSGKAEHYYGFGDPIMIYYSGKHSILSVSKEVAQSTLFFPDAGFTEAKKEIESFLRSRGAMPLTAGQRCADWFTARQFRCTATMAADIAAKRMSSRALITESRGNISEAAEQSALLRQFTYSWFSRSTSTSAMKEGTKNEPRVWEAVRDLSYVHEIFECGLLCREREPWLAASPDGVVTFTLQTGEKMTGTLEIKTATNQQTTAEADSIMGRYGRDIDCQVQGRTWWAVIPLSHRGQLLHQMFVLGVTHALYVRARKSQVTATPEQMLSYAAGVYDLRGILEWAHAPSPSVPAHYPEDIREILASHLPFWAMLQARIMKSGPLRPTKIFKHAAQAIYNKTKGGVDGSTEFHEVCSVSNQAKRNLSFEQRFVLRSLNTVWINAGVAWRMWTKKESLDAGDASRTIASYRRAFSSVEPISDFLGEAAEEICGLKPLRTPLKAISYAVNQIPGNTIASPIPSSRCGTVKVLEWFNGSDGKKLRLSGLHVPSRPEYDRNGILIEHVKPCTLCPRRNLTYCSICMQFLCVHDPQNPNMQSCWHKFHARQQVRMSKEKEDILKEKAHSQRKRVLASAAKRGTVTTPDSVSRRSGTIAMR